MITPDPIRHEVSASAPSVERRTARLDHFVKHRATPPKGPEPRTRNPIPPHPPTLL